MGPIKEEKSGKTNVDYPLRLADDMYVVRTKVIKEKLYIIPLWNL
jgi:hypothetical protein